MRIFLSGPSGVGKTTIVKKILLSHPKMRLSVSYTTRESRINEEPGKDYFFVSKDVFEGMIKGSCFLEWATVHGNYYGTSIDWLEEQEARGMDILFDIDVQGVRQAKENQSPGKFILIVPPDMDELFKRLSARGTENTASMKTRMANAKKELRYWEMYDYLVINKDIGAAIGDIEAIIRAEHLLKKEAIRRLEWLEKIE